MDWIIIDRYNELMSKGYSQDEVFQILREQYDVDDSTLYRLFH